jgi:hypothetical protein
MEKYNVTSVSKGLSFCCEAKHFNPQHVNNLEVYTPEKMTVQEIYQKLLIILKECERQINIELQNLQLNKINNN